MGDTRFLEALANQRGKIFTRFFLHARRDFFGKEFKQEIWHRGGPS